MFNLDKAISAWRRRMAAEGLKSNRILDELESHLRDDIEEQLHSGTSAADAFEAAVRRLGPADALSAEFAGTGAAWRRPAPAAMRALRLAFAMLVLAIDAWTLFAFDISRAERLTGLAAVSLIALYIALLPYLARWVPTALKARAPAAMKIASNAAVVWVFLALLNSLRLIHLPVGIALEMIMWTLCAAVIAAIAHGAIENPGRDAAGTCFRAASCRNITPAARESLEIAGMEARRLRHDYIGTEHLLLGLLGSEPGAVIDFLLRLGLDRNDVRSEIAKQVLPGHGAEPRGDLRYTPCAQRALAAAAAEAAAFNQSMAGPEHILLGLLLEQTSRGVAGRVLKSLGMDAQFVRKEILRHLGSDPDDGALPMPAG